MTNFILLALYILLVGIYLRLGDIHKTLKDKK